MPKRRYSIIQPMISQHDNTECLVCFDAICNNDYITPSKCLHKLCRSCATQILFNDSPKCPLDYIKIEEIYDSLKSQDSKTSQKIEDFRNYVMTHESLSLIEEIENNWATFFLRNDKVINEIIKAFEDIKKMFEAWIMKDEAIDEAEIDIVHKLADMIYQMCEEIYEEQIPVHQKTKFFSEFVKELPEKELTLFHLNICNVGKIIYRVALPQMNFKCLKNTQISHTGFIKRTIKFIEEDISDMKVVSLFVKSQIITFLSNSEKTFRSVQPDFEEKDLNKCLICSNTISEMSFTGFPSCSHKICTSCTYAFMITHGSCPFDGDRLESLKCVIETTNEEYNSQEDVEDHETALNNILSIYPDLSSAIFREISEFNDSKVIDLIDDKYYFTMLMEYVIDLDLEMGIPSPRPEEIELLVRRIKNEFRDILHNKPQRTFTAKYSKFSLLIDSCKMFENKVPSELYRTKQFTKTSDILFYLLHMPTFYYDCFLIMVVRLEETLWNTEDLRTIENDIKSFVKIFFRISKSFSKIDPNYKLISLDLYRDLQKEVETFVSTRNIEFGKRIIHKTI